MTTALILLISAYFLGSIPTGLLLSKAAGVDIRTTGSGNIGATNVYRTLGPSIGVMTLIGDCLKGLLPVMLAEYLQMPDIWVAAIGLAAFLGHVYTIFLGFKGGKGVATALGVFLGIAPLAVCGALIVFVGAVWWSRYISLGSISAAAAMPIILALTDPAPAKLLMTVIVATLVISKHRDNFQRIRTGTESKFKA